MVKKNYADAAADFAQAGRMFGIELTAPFQVFTLCREANRTRKQGKWGLSAECMTEACRVIQLFDPQQTHLLSAATWKHQGWAFMDEWRFRDAEAAFKQAEAILDKNIQDKSKEFEAAVDHFHVRHGLAMSERFRGRDEEALKHYRELTPEIAKKIRQLEGRREQESTYQEIRALLYQRLVNTLERQGDCNLFGAKPDFAEAEDDYRRALAESNHLPEKEREDRKTALFYKLSIALGIPSRTQDLDRAEALCALGDKRFGVNRPRNQSKSAADETKLPATRSDSSKASEAKPAADKSEPTGQPSTENIPPVVKTEYLDFLGELAYTLSRRGDDPESRRAVRKELRDAIKNRIHANSSTLINRDDLEALMFACKFLLLHREQGTVRDRFDAANDARQLLTFCRMAKRTDGSTQKRWLTCAHSTTSSWKSSWSKSPSTSRSS